MSITAVNKLREKKILNENSLIHATIKKDFFGSPVEKTVCMKISSFGIDHVMAVEYNEATDEPHKIKMEDIQQIDGMEPEDLAAVYGLVPKTARFKRRKEE